MARGKFIECKGAIDEALDGCEFEALRDEMTEWRDNMEGTGLESTEKYQIVSETADALESAMVDEKANELLQAIEAAVEGKPFKAGCPEHVEGQRCKRCGWDGKAHRGESFPTFKEYDPPKRQEWGSPGDSYHKVEFAVAVQSRGCSWTTWTVKEGEDPGPEREKARAQHEAEVRKITERNERNRLGRRIPDEPEVEPCEVIAEALDGKQITWSEFRKYGKRAMNLSRSDRMSNASAALTAAIDFLREALSGHEDDEPVAEVLEKVDELESAIQECEGVEFPGMFG